MPSSLRIPKVREHGEGKPPDAALFSHVSHDVFTCFQCHPGIFPQKKLGFTHEDMEAGLYCGACHDGRRAFAPKDKGVSCEACHVSSEKKPEIDEDELW